MPHNVSALCASAVLLFAGVLSGCGGGGGAPAAEPEPVPAGGYTLSGTLSLPETAAVDSDTNDPTQTPRLANDTLSTAQGLVSPVYLIGSVNQPGEGAPGANFSVGDVVDGFQVDLVAGQVIELEFSADPTVNDLDLYVYANGAVPGDAPIGESSGVNRYECLRITTDARYFIAVDAYSGASIYNLRIGAPNDGSTCGNAVAASAGIIAGEVVAKTAGTSRSAASKRAQTLAADVSATGDAGSTTVPQLLRLPAERSSRAAALSRAAAAGGKRLAPAASAAATAALPDALRDVIDTVHYAKDLRRSGLYAYAEPNVRARLSSALVGTFPPADRLYPNQRWHYEMIKLPAAMATLVPLQGQFTQRPVIAVIDSGIVADHPDLAAQIVGQASFTNGGTFTTSADDPSDPGAPTGFHGTHVAGTAAALTFDANGVAGVAPMAQLLPIRVFAKGASTANSSDIAQAILYAAGLPNSSNTVPPRRADVINLSLGSARACPAVYSDVIAQARAAGVVVVAAAGNDSQAGRDAPSNCAGAISVGAVDARRQRAFYSNTDPALSVTAPGGDSSQSTTGNGLPDEVYSTIGDFNGNARVPSYGGMMGTSMATPHVVGVMALMRYANPAITVEQIDGLLVAGRLTDDLGIAGQDSSFGFGLINASKAVTEALALTGANPTPVAGTIIAQPSSVDFGAVRTTADIDITVQGGASTEGVTSIVSSSGAITVAPAAVDAAGLGTYLITVSRETLPLGSTFATLQVTTSAGRQFAIQISVTKVAPGAPAPADYGRVYVLVIDPDAATPVNLAATATSVSNGQYQWQVTGITSPRVQIVAGTDVDNDSLLCQRGEACGGYPQFGAGAAVVDLTGDRHDIDFELSIYGGINATAASARRYQRPAAP